MISNLLICRFEGALNHAKHLHSTLCRSTLNESQYLWNVEDLRKVRKEVCYWKILQVWFHSACSLWSRAKLVVTSESILESKLYSLFSGYGCGGLSLAGRSPWRRSWITCDHGWESLQGSGSSWSHTASRSSRCQTKSNALEFLERMKNLFQTSYFHPIPCHLTKVLTCTLPLFFPHPIFKMIWAPFSLYHMSLYLFISILFLLKTFDKVFSPKHPRRVGGERVSESGQNLGVDDDLMT